MIGSSSASQIYQADPPEGHRLSRGWKTLNGQRRESKELAVCLVINRRLRGRDYPLEAVIKFDGDVSVNEHNTLWKKYAKNMKRRGIVALWVREPSKKNRVHCHLLIVAPDVPEAAEDAIRSSCPTGYEDRLRLHVKAVVSQRGVCYYLPKAKTRGYDPVKKRVTSDKWESKRLLFASWVTLRKYGSIGPFWAKPKASIWKGVIQRERGINLHLADVNEEARKLTDLTGEPLRKISRSLAYFAWKNSMK